MGMSYERAALIGLLFRGPRMQWAKFRDRFVAGERPSDLASPEDIARGEDILQRWQAASNEASFYTYFDRGYPRQLLEVWDFPPFVFIKGDETPLRHWEGYSDVGVSVVGSRTPTRGARNDTVRIVRGLIDQKITIVSGLAEGIDQTAHHTALHNNARTVGVIGTGIDRYYPESSRPYQEAMESGHGMVLSQFVPGAAPARYSFPMRNAVMSAYGRATIIVEASEKSGTRHQAQHAVKHGRPVILAEPVVYNTEWGRQLASDPSMDVHIAESPEHAVWLARRRLSQRSPEINRSAETVF